MFRLHFVVLVTFAAAVLADDVIILKQGSLEGHRLTTRRGRQIFAFQGIPYAKPPVGDLRFKPPQPPEPWSGVLDATKEAPICVQKGLFPSETYMKGQEDCLYLNVYTPRIPEDGEMLEPLEVMFWIYGGGYFAGSGNTEMYGPQYLLDKDVILVTMNYRLGALGFLTTGDAVCPGNNGLKDQVAALRWVQENIAVFGGNPNVMTIFGESAGGYSVHLHMLSPMSKGLFRHAISQSGNALCSRAIVPLESSKRLTEKVATLFQCPTTPSEDLISCLRKQDAHDLFASDRSLSEAGGSNLGFRPVIESDVGEGDKAFISESPMETLTNGKVDLVPWMSGITSGEGAFFHKHLFKKDTSEINLEDNLLSTLLDDTVKKEDVEKIVQKVKEFYFRNKPFNNESISAFADMCTDALFLSPTNTAVKLHSRRGGRVFYYYFDYRGSNSFSSLFLDPKVNYGVLHLDDIQYLFPQDHHFPDMKKSPDDEYMIDFMTTLWVNFARTGMPIPSWDPVSSLNILEYANINAEGLRMGKGLLTERVNFWDSLPIKSRYPTTTNKDEL